MLDIGITRRKAVGAAAAIVAMSGSAGAANGADAKASGRSAGAPPAGSGGIIRRDLKLDVSQAVPAAVSGGAAQWLGARLIAPAAIDTRQAVPVVVCVHGGTYDKRYYDAQIPGRAGYSMAEHFARHGAIVVALDYLGISDSSRPPNMAGADRHVMAAAQNAAANDVFARLSAGTLDKAVPALPHIRRIGLAHSMGVMLTITQQAAHRTYEQVALLGYSVRGVELQRAKLATQPPVRSEAEELAFTLVQRERLRPEYYLEDVPADVIAGDEAATAPAPRAISAQAQTAGVVLADAGKITAPVFYALGERDISPNPHAEPGTFTSCNDLTFHIVKGSAHCQNLANTRVACWDRTLAWIDSVKA